MESQHINCVCCDPINMDCSVPAVGCSDSFWTCLPDPPCLVADDVTSWERFEALSEDKYDCYGRSDSFYYDDPRDFEEWCAWNDVDEEEGYYAPCSSDVMDRISFPGTACGRDADTVGVLISWSCRISLVTAMNFMGGGG